MAVITIRFDDRSLVFDVSDDLADELIDLYLEPDGDLRGIYT